MFHQTGTISQIFLAGVTVFFTSSMNNVSLSASEKSALVNWVKAGGMLIVTGEDQGHLTQTAYSSILTPFSIGIDGGTTAGYATILNSHPLLGNASSIYLAGSATLYPMASHLKLLNDHAGYLAEIVAEYTPEVGSGRVLVIGDTDMFTDTYMVLYEENETLFKAMANWVNNPASVLKGTVSLGLFNGNPAGLTLDISIEDAGLPLETVSTTVDSQGRYSVQVNTQVVPYDVVAKMPQWLSEKVTGVQINPGPNSLVWSFAYNGDATHDNAIDLFDLNSALVANAQTGINASDVDGDGLVGITDLNAVLVNFGRTGE